MNIETSFGFIALFMASYSNKNQNKFCLDKCREYSEHDG